jgi:hypothetical protein
MSSVNTKSNSRMLESNSVWIHQRIQRMKPDPLRAPSETVSSDSKRRASQGFNDEDSERCRQIKTERETRREPHQ